MDFKQLEAFVRTVELSSFSKAAESLFLSQPSISLYVSALETELGTKLLTRTTKDVSPTRNGRIFYEYAKNMLSLREKAVFSMKSRSNSYQGELEIHASSVPAQYILPEVIVPFNRAYPNISFHITMSDTFHVINSVIAQKCEIGVVGARTETGKCDYRYITSESIVLIAPPDSRLTAQNFTELIYSENFITREEGSATRYHAEEYLTLQNIDPGRLRVVAQLTNMQSVVHAVSKGLGVSIVSEIAAREYINRNLVKVLRPEGFDLKRDFYFVHRKDAILSPKLNLFVNFVCDSYADAGTADPA
jgi:DNA-binding transcriptional LysR family regulator